jgi:hypothetical protein
MTNTQRQLYELQIEAETLADRDPLTKADMDRIVDIKFEQEKLAEGLTAAQRAELTALWWQGQQNPANVN